MAKWKQVDNSAPESKLEIRRRTSVALGQPVDVLDLFCGYGKMYEGIWRETCSSYHGVDNTKVHSVDCCTLMDNRQYLARYGIRDANCFDLDAYGSPWLLAVKIASMFRGSRMAFTLTDWTPQGQRFGQTDRFVQALSGIPRGFRIPSLQRWYRTLLAYSIREIERRSGCKLAQGWYCEAGNGAIPNRYIGLIFNRDEAK